MHGVKHNEKILVFKVGCVFCCAPVRDIESILSPVKLATFPGQAYSIAGVFFHRAKTVSVVDLRIKFGLQNVDRQTGRFIIATTRDGLMGFWVDEILEITQAPEQNWQQPPHFVSGKMFGKTLLLDGNLILSTDFQRLYDMENSAPLSAWAKDSSKVAKIVEKKSSLVESKMISSSESSLSKINEGRVEHEDDVMSLAAKKSMQAVKTESQLMSNDIENVIASSYKSLDPDVVSINTNKKNDTTSNKVLKNVIEKKENDTNEAADDALITENAVSDQSPEAEINNNAAPDEQQKEVIISDVIPISVTNESLNNVPAKSTIKVNILPGKLFVTICLVMLISVFFVFFWMGVKAYVLNVPEKMIKDKQFITPAVETLTIQSADDEKTSIIGAQITDVVKERHMIGTEPVVPNIKRLNVFVLPVIPEWGMYTVVRGDTLWAISIRFYATPYRYPDLAKWSVIESPDLIFPDEIIIYQKPVK